jgi:glucosyl-3-phosphoglycerate synthase
MMILNRLFTEGTGGKMISVVIPALNESATIASVVEFARSCPLVEEVIVVDDGSIDGTAEIANAMGATVITSTMLGKGMSMEDGMRLARNDVVVYLDGDLQSLHHNAIEMLARPVLLDEADFVKAKFSRRAGRVTALTAKPLLRTYFPELAHLDQPLSGLMAARKSLLEQFTFENDYGVDIGLLIDAALARARIAEVDIGALEHRSHSLEALGEMATQVARALLSRAARAGRLRPSFIRNVKENERRSGWRLEALLGRMPATVEKIALFDMDGVLLDGRFIVSLAEETGKESDLAALLDNYALAPGDRMKRIAAVFAGARREVFERVARNIPLIPGAIDTVVALRKAGYTVGVVTDTYQLAAETVRRRVFADFGFAHLMRFKGDKAVGRVTRCPAMVHPNGCPAHDHCKSNILQHLVERFEICPSKILAVGDGENDICMLKRAGCSVAFRGKTAKVRKAAQFQTNMLSEIVSLAGVFRTEPLREAQADPIINEELRTFSN